jgi:hypothetical protein
MAKPTKHATPICIVLSIIAALGILIGILAQSALVTIIFLIPTVVYEIYRTEGKSTKWASWTMLGVLIVEIVLILFNVTFDLAQFLEVDEKYVAGYNIPLGDIKIVGPTLMAVLSIILFVRTRGKYTRWLAVIIFITSFAIVFNLDQTIFERLIKFAIEEVLNLATF